MGTTIAPGAPGAMLPPLLAPTAVPSRAGLGLAPDVVAPDPEARRQRDLAPPPVAIDLEAQELRLVAQLERQVPGARVEAWPEDPRTFPLRAAVGLLVAYAGGDFEGADAAVRAQGWVQRWGVTVLARSLRGATGASGTSSGGDAVTGAYAALEAVRGALVGLRLPGCSPLRARSERFLGREGPLWLYAAQFECRSTIVADAPPLDAPALAAAQVDAAFAAGPPVTPPAPFAPAFTVRVPQPPL